MGMKRDEAFYAAGGICILLAIILTSIFLDRIFPPQSPSDAWSGTDKSAGSPAADEAHIADASGRIVIEEFSDFQCPFCASEAPTVGRIRKQYAGNVEVIYRHFPIEKIHPISVKAALAAECMRDQGLFWEYHDKLFSDHEKLSDAFLRSAAEDLGADMASFGPCLASQAKASVIKADFTDGRDRGVQGTPTFFVNGIKHEGSIPYDEFARIITDEMQYLASRQNATEASP